MVAWYKDSKKEFLKKYVVSGHAKDMIPLAGEEYTNTIYEPGRSH